MSYDPNFFKFQWSTSVKTKCPLYDIFFIKYVTKQHWVTWHLVPMCRLDLIYFVIPFDHTTLPHRYNWCPWCTEWFQLVCFVGSRKVKQCLDKNQTDLHYFSLKHNKQHRKKVVLCWLSKNRFITDVILRLKQRLLLTRQQKGNFLTFMTIA